MLLLSICRASFYHPPRQEKQDNLEMMRLMDAHILEEPTAGVLTMQEEAGYKAGYERVRRLMRLANIQPIYPCKHLTQLGERQYIYP